MRSQGIQLSVAFCNVCEGCDRDGKQCMPEFVDIIVRREIGAVPLCMAGTGEFDFRDKKNTWE